ncbi:MAG: bifunctional UDP-N-acetylmuramoyl-tripeptide:D-alanyl-D-alanine ligase/alanine racemase [Chitinophagia bacterium]|nr:bifunctional UDP-N-acetylmuramoyl-tripeptide:D-alanyl-D-alanine ligase/alanine racemase [Chitinophagia bacterium]
MLFPATIEHLLIDSRSLLFPATTLFFAIRTSQNDGHHYIPELYQRGVRNFIISQEIDERKYEGSNFLKVNDVVHALQTIAKDHRSHFNYPVIGITGSNGKTIVKEWLYQLLENKFKIIRSPRSYNSQIGVPLSVWEMSSKHDLAIFEAGVSQQGEMNALTFMIQPSIGIITSLGTAHQEGFDSIQQKWKEKWLLCSHSKTVIVNADDLIANDISIPEKMEDQEIILWGKSQFANFKIVSEQNLQQNTYLKASYQDQLLSLTIPFTDKVSIQNAITCWVTLLHLNIPVMEIQAKMNQLTHLDMRMQIKKGNQNCLLLNDSYSNDIHSLQLALEYAQQQAGNLSLTLILSDLYEEQIGTVNYSVLLNTISRFHIKKFIVIGPQLSAAIAPHQDLKISELFCFQNVNEFEQKMDLQSFRDEFILIKGSRIFALEKINALLQLQTHETKVEINLTALVANYKKVKKTIGAKVKVMAMVKAFGYGAGSVEVARVLQFHHVDYLAVAYTDEGIALRQSGIHIPIMVMNVDASSFDALIKYQLEPEIFSFQLLNQFYHFIRAQGILGFPIHLKLNTGMNRLGFDMHEIPALAEVIQEMPSLKVQSIFSHLSASGQAAYLDFTQSQLSQFKASAFELEQSMGYVSLKHIANSGAILMHPQYHLDMVRLGIGLYGIGEKSFGWENVIQLTTTISQIRKLPAGSFVGYNRAGLLHQDSVIATVRLGYADGYHRKLGKGKGAMWVHGKLAPTVGDICMDMTMIDVTDVKDISLQDEVEIFGEHIAIETLATWSGINMYEMMSGINARVKRIYIEE